jgi:hypothetical protein
MTYDLFISHSSKEKKQYVLPICQEFEKHKINFWHDSTEIKWGDNFIDKL